MRVVVTGATGNVGTSVLAALALHEEVSDIIGVARRRPDRTFAKTRFIQADVSGDDLRPSFAGADVVIHLAWLIQPGRSESITHRVNVEGSRRVFAAAVDAGVGSLIYASSVGVYSPGPKDRPVDESWPAQGVPTSFYSRHKVAVERILDSVESAHPELRVVRLRPGLIFKAEAATEVRRLFLGPFFPTSVLRHNLVPLFPDLARLRIQAVHSDDVATAYTLAALNPDARGAFNIAAGPPLGPREFAEVLKARRVPVPRTLLRAGADAAFRLRLSPTEPGWLDLALDTPLMAIERAGRELGWEPRRDAVAALADIIRGMGRQADDATPPLAGSTTAPARVKEFMTGLGRRP